MTLEQAKLLSQNNKRNRVAKMRALSEFIPQNAVDQDGDAFHGDGGIIANFNGYNAVVQKQIIAESIAIIDASQQQQQGEYEPHSPTYSPTTPTSMAMDVEEGEVRDEGLHINIPQTSSSRRSRNVGTKEDDSGGSSPDIPAVTSTAVTRGSIPIGAFDVYQRAVIDAVRRIENYNPNTVGEMQLEQYQILLNVIYEVFFGYDQITGEMTSFHTNHGAAPVTGMNPEQLTLQATQAKRVQSRLNQSAEERLGFLRTFLQPIIAREGDRKIQSGLGEPMGTITALMQATRNIHVAAAHLINSDPLFVANRAQRAQQGHLAVRSVWGNLIYAVGQYTYKQFVEIIAKLPGGVTLATTMDEHMPAAYRSSHLAINQFEHALDQYDKLYQSLPPEARLCWTLPFPRGEQGYNEQLPRYANKPGFTTLTTAMASSNGAERKRLLTDARGTVITEPIPTYPAFLTTTVDGQGNTVANGPLLAYYYALHGGRILEEQHGREWLQDAFVSDPTRYLREIGALTKNLATLNQQMGRDGKFFSSATARVDLARLKQGSPGAEGRLIHRMGLGPVGTMGQGGTAFICQPGDKRSMCQKVKAMDPRRLGSMGAASLRQWINPELSSQQGRPLLSSSAVFTGLSNQQQQQQLSAFRGDVAQQKSDAVTQAYARDQSAQSGRKVTEGLLRGIREAVKNIPPTSQSNNVFPEYRNNTVRVAFLGDLVNPETNTYDGTGILTALNQKFTLWVKPEKQKEEISDDQSGKKKRPTTPTQERWQPQVEDSTSLWRVLIDAYPQFGNINHPRDLMNVLGQLGKKIIKTAIDTPRNGFIIGRSSTKHTDDHRFMMIALGPTEVRTLANSILQNVLWSYSSGITSKAQRDHLLKTLSQMKGGKKTRRHKKRRKKTHRYRHHGKKTRHRHKKKKRTRKH